MREIRFRAWDKITRRWLNDYNDLWLNLEGEVFFMTTTGGYEGHDYLKKLDAEVCLYTGLKDKRGIEIYEGDIVKHLTSNEKWEPLDDNSPVEIETTSKVEYNGHGFWLSNEYFGWEGEGLANWDDLEVIGNIYSNPELLNQK